MDPFRERACLICGCTEARACMGDDGPCAWVEDESDLCTVCLEAAEPHAISLLRIGCERARQVSAEGYDAAHDDQYRDGQLARAAECYAKVAASAELRADYPVGNPPVLWPWAPEYWKPVSPERDLIRAGALIVAELERLARAAQTPIPGALS